LATAGAAAGGAGARGEGARPAGALGAARGAAPAGAPASLLAPLEPLGVWAPPGDILLGGSARPCFAALRPAARRR